jgi:phage portal protein BeeE
MPYVLTTGGLFMNSHDANRRGVNVYNMTETRGITGRSQDGQLISAEYQQPLFTLTYDERMQIYQRCDAVFAVVNARARRIAGLEWQVVKQTKEEDRLEHYLKSWKQLYDEYGDDQTLKGAVVRADCLRMSRQYLPDLRPDMANFTGALLRWRRRIRDSQAQDADQITEWLREPNLEDNFSDFINKMVADMMVHGSGTIYKEYQDKVIENFYVLPGGSVLPMRSKFVGGGRGFVQWIPGIEPKVYFTNEISYIPYMPSSAVSYGMVPLEALVNKVAESLLFDQYSAEKADGTKVPEKMVVFGDNSPFGSLTGGDDLSLPISKEEQSRIEMLMNEPRKDAIRVLSGHGQPAVVDLSRADTYQHQMQRQKDIRETVALVYNMSNMEVNLTGGGDTSGRSTSESQERIEKEKGVAPIVMALQEKINREILPFRFGSAYMFEFRSGTTDLQQADIDQKKMQTQTYSVNQIRIERGDDPFQDEKYDEPPAPGAMGGESGQPGQGQEDPAADMAGLLGGV